MPPLLKGLYMSLQALEVAGCASVALQRQQEAWQQASYIIHACESRRKAGQLSSYVASMQCSNDRAHQVIQESGYPYMDLVNLLAAFRLAVGRRIDEGTLAEDDAQVQWAELTSRVAAEEQHRNAKRQQAYNQWLMSYGMLLQGLETWNQSWTPPVCTGPITCSQAGSMITGY
jgi:hypothetical protein